MTMLKPTLILDHIAVFKDGHNVLNSAFHKGVNIVRGHNSSGKTTVLDFIAYTLGAENIPWKQEALLCDTSMAQLSLNQRTVTVRRDVNDKPQNPMYIFWGPLQDAVKASFDQWEVFPFRRSPAKISFTQALLLAMDLPEAQGDGASNLTMHQFLRVMYADQPSLHSPIFRTDSFDSALTRETVGNYLCGIFDDTLYSAQLERRDLDKDVARLSLELKSIYSVLARSKRDVSLEFFDQQIELLSNERKQLVADLNRIKQERTLDKDTRLPSKTENIRADLDQAKKILIGKQDRLTKIGLEIADSNSFVNEIETRLRAIDESAVARKIFGSINFTFCPCCLSPIQNDSSTDSCLLCKHPLESAPADGQVLRMKNELRIQLQESRILRNVLDREASELKAEMPGLLQNLKKLEALYEESSSAWTTDVEIAVEGLARQIGAYDKEIEGLFESQKMALVIQELQQKRDGLQSRINELDSLIEKLEFAQVSRQQEVSQYISESLSRLLRKDMYRQKEFLTANNVTFSFADNEITVDGAKKFSESSTVVLRHLFHIALLSASNKFHHMRLPRFMILDGIEDGGIELPRAHLLQQIIVDECSNYENDFQLIFATSQIAPTLESDELVAGRYYTEEKRSLELL